MSRYRFHLEDFVVEVATGEIYYVMGTPLNCKMRSSKEPGYVISNRSGTTLLLTQQEMENGDFEIRKNHHPPI